MKLLHRLFGIRTTASPEQIRGLWERALALTASGEQPEKVVRIYTELLALVDEYSPIYDVCAILRNRAIAHRRVGEHAAALDDLARELEIAQRRGDELRAMQCRSVIEQTRQMLATASLEGEGGERALQAAVMQELAGKLWREPADFESAFRALFAELTNLDAGIRLEAARHLGESPDARRRLVAIYEEAREGDLRRATLAGRVVGRRAAAGLDGPLDAEITRVFHGMHAAILSCACAHCGALNAGIPTPPAGPAVPYYTQVEASGAYAVPVLCDACGKEFYVVWDEPL